ncbi:glycoprotein 3-alpha-L-fucosyltransferase A [Caerostris darwini]|uniref:Fucosyltransferase n=1 Tax=Caerostris darwini TaxID=1538125 RepID=A0AAV4TXQ0_9ARAC|nr:glycoprotein 3-alpha-L-fucosyltransferase A [Caerostris darwini]
MFLFLLLLGVLYNLYIASSNRWTSIEIQKNKNRERNAKVIYPSHYSMPSFYKGKQLPFHQVYEPREVGFPADMQTTKVYNKTKLILVWTSWNSLRKTINYYFLQGGSRSFVEYNCPNPNCRVTFKRKNLRKADAILFHLIDTKAEDLPPTRHPRQVWILYNMEPPWLVKKQAGTQLHLLNNRFNWTMSYRNKSDVVARYGFTMSSTKSFNRIVGEKSRNVVWFASDCLTDSKREDYVKEMQKYIDVDVYGSCGNHRCYPSQSFTCYSEILKNYRFYLSFENAICTDYVTEKFFNAFNFDIVPVVMGALDYSLLIPKNSFINAVHYPEPKTLAETLLKIASNSSEYIEFLKNKALFKAFLDPWMCRLCDRLHSYTGESILKDVEKWFFGDAHCKEWNNTLRTYVDSDQA